MSRYYRLTKQVLSKGSLKTIFYLWRHFTAVFSYVQFYLYLKMTTDQNFIYLSLLNSHFKLNIVSFYENFKYLDKIRFVLLF